MLKIRLQRKGKRNYATYRVVIAEDRAPIKGRRISDIGYYNPHTDEFVVDKDAVSDWLSKGVKPSPTVHNLLVTHKIINEDKVTSWQPKKKVIDDSDKKEEANKNETEKKDSATDKAPKATKDEKPATTKKESTEDTPESKEGK